MTKGGGEAFIATFPGAMDGKGWGAQHEVGQLSSLSEQHPGIGWKHMQKYCCLKASNQGISAGPRDLVSATVRRVSFRYPLEPKSPGTGKPNWLAGSQRQLNIAQLPADMSGESSDRSVASHG